MQIEKYLYSFFWTKFIYNNVENITEKAIELNNSYKSSGVSIKVNIDYGRRL